MRIRRKKHLAERLEIVSDYLIVPSRDIVNVLEAVKDKQYFDYNEIFGNSNPIELEIGCGKGGFIVQKAEQNQNINFLAVELLENIIVMAAENAKNKNLKNVKFINSGAEYLPRYVKEKSVQNIYLNFLPPFPKDGYENRRLTSDWYMNAYKSFLIDGGCVYQKTDDEQFFNYSKSKFVEFGFDVVDNTDLISGDSKNIMTEYERKFVALGMKVFSLIAKK